MWRSIGNVAVAQDLADDGAFLGFDESIVIAATRHVDKLGTLTGVAH